MSQFTAIRRDLHQIPELGFQEFKTQAYLLGYLQSLPQERMEIKTWRTGILVKINGRNPSKTIGWRTDIDGLPIAEQTGLPFASTHEGRMHACGHDLHMSIALGVVTHFASNPADDHFLFIFQPAEEGPGGAEPMMASPEFREWMPDEIYALHIAPEHPAGTIATKPGLLFANTSELFIDIRGKGGHAAYPHETKDMVVAASYFITQLQSIVSRNVDPLDSAVVTVGKMTAGTVQNVIADHARLEGTIRTLSPEAMEKAKVRVQALLKGIETAFDCETEIDCGSGYYQVFNDPEVTGRFVQFATQQPDIQFVQSREAMTGEDFGFMLKEIPGLMFWLGVGSDYGLHHAKLTPDEKAIETAISFINRYFTHLGSR
ncbi:N-acetyldiaminopimelate deacetylase [Domibacillus enclensis]|uniref:N-acetyldiaminopimelate deacetylase n=1 Tax=Domibacillus enclensis TaxID=1017273 RepID=A0A1N6U2G7_9BACI|nr:N-acetyldiaminopimelate deacetylase [Domibacillus enclensis]OXS78419.1 N-acetyldiaminopimelate deacetylase [Domibacillus enclensis]SIQ59794.1 N-acetyldiaminopimelate deacetylase [Domibacillus enclensis]